MDDQIVIYFFFFQAEDGIRDDLVTGVQTCALPIWLLTTIVRLRRRCAPGEREIGVIPAQPHDRREQPGRRDGPRFAEDAPGPHGSLPEAAQRVPQQSGRASCRERVYVSLVAVALKE